MISTKARALWPQIKQVWHLSLPAILTQITTIAMQYIDSAMVGALGANASAAIGLVASTTWLVNSLPYAVSSGFSVSVAHHIGGQKPAEARAVVRHGLITGAVLSGFLCLLAALASGPLPLWLGGEESLHADASAYFLMFALMLPFSQLDSLCSSFLQCCGDMVTPSVLNAVMCVLDVVFNAIFIPLYGVLGAGLGTTLACAVVSLAMAYCCCVRNDKLRLRGSERSPFDPAIIRNALKIGTPVAVQELAMNGAMVAATVIIAPLGAVSIAANSFAVTAESLCYMPGYGVGMAAASLVGRSIGAGDEKLARRYGNICTAMGAVLMAGTGLLMMLICPLVFRMLTPDTAVQALATKVLRLELFAEPLFGISIVAAGALRGADDTLIPSILNVLSIWVVRLGLALLLVPRMGLMGMWVAMTVELCVRGLLMLCRQLTSKFYARSAAKHQI